jgi:hypothetical protein
MTSSASKKTATSSKSALKLSLGRYEFPNVIEGALVLFGMYVCWCASCDGPMPHASLEWLKSIGLFIFRSEWVLRLVFWLAVVLHGIEALISLYYSLAHQSIRGDHQTSLGFVAFWFIQTFIFGYPSLRLIKEQSRVQSLTLAKQMWGPTWGD